MLFLTAEYILGYKRKGKKRIQKNYHQQETRYSRKVKRPKGLVGKSVTFSKSLTLKVSVSI